MLRSLRFILAMAVSFSLLASTVLAEGTHASFATTEAIESIVLTTSPSFGLPEDMIDTVRTFTPNDALTSLLNERGFFTMPEYLDTGVMDGDYTWITVNFKNGESKRVGGLEAEKDGPEDFIIIYEAVISAQEIPSDQSILEEKSILRLAVFPTGTTAESYYFVLGEDGVLYGAVGTRENDDIAQSVFLKQTDSSSEIALTALELQLVINLSNELESIDYCSEKQYWTDSWDIALLYNGKVYEMNYWHNDAPKEFMDLVNMLIVLSPIPVDLHGWA